MCRIITMVDIKHSLIVLSLTIIIISSEESDDSHILTSIIESMIEWRNRRMYKERNGHRQRRDEEMVCYRDLGCFRDEGPFDYLDTLPAPPQEIGTRFTLITRMTASNGGEYITYDNVSSVINSKINASNAIKVIIHGFGSSGKRPWVKQMAEAFIGSDDFNIIIVDWEKGAALPNYVQAAANSRLVAKQLAKLIAMINTVKGITGNHYHLIGFSLGAHIAGLTGMAHQNEGGTNITRITGLDPASPLFEGYPANVRLDPSDATFVDVIHSNADSLLRLGLGFSDPMGHVDFYPNGGRFQLGCHSNVYMSTVTDLFTGNWHSLCNHRRAIRFFIDSLKNCTFGAYSCDNYDNYLKGECFTCGSDGSKCGIMGINADKTAGKGMMYLVTRESEPFCSNQYRIKITSAKGQGSTIGKLEIKLINSEIPNYNETFTLTSDSDEIIEQGFMQGLLVAHPNITNVSYMIITYTKYKGWIYSGKDSWSIDKIEINSRSPSSTTIMTLSHCGHLQLNDTTPIVVTLTLGNCTLIMNKNKHNFNSVNTVRTEQKRMAKFFWKLITATTGETDNKLWWNFMNPDTRESYLWSPFW